VDYNLYPLWVFVNAVKHSNITRAAEFLAISQPAASGHIRALEKSLGVQLLERTRRGVLPSSAGEVVYHRALRIFAELEDLKSLSQRHSTVRVVASTMPGAYWLPDRLREFREHFPLVFAALSICDSVRSVRAVLDFECTLAVVGEVPQLSHPDLYRVEVAQDELALVARPENPVLDRTALEGEDFAGQTLVRRELGSSTRSQSDSMLAPYLGYFAHVLEFPSAEAVREAVLAGLGVAVVSSWSVARELKSGLLCRAVDPHLRRSRSFFLVRRRDRPAFGPAALLWDFLASAAPAAVGS